MSYINDRIRKCGEFTSQGDNKANNGSFYLFLVPKSGTQDSVAVVNAKAVENAESAEIPLMVGSWSPIVLASVNLSLDNISKFRVFWGAE